MSNILYEKFFNIHSKLTTMIISLNKNNKNTDLFNYFFNIHKE